MIRDDETALLKLRCFFDLAAGRLSDWITFQPTVARLEVADDDRVRSAKVPEWNLSEGLWKRV